MKTLITLPKTNQFSFGWKALPAILFALCSLISLSANAQTWTVGTGTSQFSSTATSPASPLGYYRQTARMQFLYLASELTAAGATAGNFNQIAFNVGSVNGATAAPNYQIQIGGTTATTLSSIGWAGGLTAVFTSSSYAPIPGWNIIPFSSPYSWNGTDNVIIDVCYYNTAGLGVANAGVYYNSGPNNYATSGTLFTSTSFCNGGNPSPTGANTSYRPNIQFIRLSPCSGKPNKGTLFPSGTVTTTCPGTSVTVYDTGYTNAALISLAWQTSTNGTTWTTIPGATSDRYATPPIISSVYYRMLIFCGVSGQSDTTAAVYFNQSSAGYPNYATLPFHEGFEGTWGNGCATGDKVASNNWTNLPATGDLSWRRDDDNTSASWYIGGQFGGSYFHDGAHSARFHNYGAYYQKKDQYGNLSLYLNTSGSTGNIDLSFWRRGDYYTNTYDSLFLDMSYDSGANFTQIQALGNPIDLNWYKTTIPNINTHNSPKTIFRFRAKCGGTYGPGYADSYIDDIDVFPPCDATPVAGVIDSVVACKGQIFTLNATGTSKAAGLSYLWQYKAPTAAFWTNLSGAVNPTTSMTAATNYRVIVTCNNTIPTTSDTSAVYAADLAPFYYCYCSANQSSYYNQYGYSYCLVGNVTIATQPAFDTILYNGNPFPTLGNSSGGTSGYEDFRLTVPPTTLVRDSTYLLGLTQTSGPTTPYWESGMYGVAWIDFDHDGTFSNSSERILSKTVPSQTNNVSQGTFTVPTFAPVGITGMRVTIQYAYPSASSISPCGPSAAYGQFEDYLVKIDYTPCTGPSDPGTAIVSDSIVCPGYTIDLIDTTYEKTHTNISRYWQESLNGGASYAVLPGSKNIDILYNVVLKASSKFRLMVVCDYSGDTTYSIPVSVTAPSPVHCYPVSTSALGSVDSSDIGSVIVGKYYNPDPATGAVIGPHLLNPAAHKRHSDFTNLTPIWELHADSTYRLAIFQTMPGANHADALVSVFIDYNNNLNYDVTAPAPPTPFTSELIYQGRTTSTRYLL
ncbi:MAG: GEVED domain-containing protein, partial [Chitinophagaceae bacterium]